MSLIRHRGSRANPSHRVVLLYVQGPPSPQELRVVCDVHQSRLGGREPRSSSPSTSLASAASRFLAVLRSPALSSRHPALQRLPTIFLGPCSASSHARSRPLAVRRLPMRRTSLRPS